MLSLPVEVLRRIPTNYRMWATLQMTSQALSGLLGDYHIAHDIHCVDDHNREIPYRKFMRVLVGYMSGSILIYGNLVMGTDCIWTVNSYGEPRVDGLRHMIAWNDRLLRIRRRDGCTVLVLERTDHWPDHYIMVGRCRYVIKEYLEPVGPSLRLIADELPALFGVMSEVKPRKLSFKDIDMN